MLDRIEKANQNVTQFACPFSQVRVLVTKNKVQMAGDLSYDASGLLSMVYSRPEGDLFEITATHLVMKNGGKERRFELAKTPMMRRLADCLLKSLSGQIRSLAAENDAVCQVMDDGRFYVVTYEAPEGTSVGYSRILIRYRKTDCRLVALELYESSGLANLYTLQHAD